jgi:hypothetical protein
MIGIGTSFQDSRRRDWVARRLRPSAVALCFGQTSVARVFRGPCEGDSERILPSHLPREAAEHSVKKRLWDTTYVCRNDVLRLESCCLPGRLSFGVHETLIGDKLIAVFSEKHTMPESEAPLGWNCQPVCLRCAIRFRTLFARSTSSPSPRSSKSI